MPFCKEELFFPLKGGLYDQNLNSPNSLILAMNVLLYLYQLIGALTAFGT